MLTEEAVREIRSLYRGGLSTRQVGERFGVTSATVGRVLSGETWSHVPDPEGPVAVRPCGGRPGGRPGKTRLDADKVREIRARRARGESGASIARRFGVTVITVRNVVRGEAWRHVT